MIRQTPAMILKLYGGKYTNKIILTCTSYLLNKELHVIAKTVDKNEQIE